MPSIVNGLFAGRSGIASHGTAIAVVGDNIANANTVGFKASRAEFEDVIAGGQVVGKVVGSGAQNSAVSMIFDQGSQERTGRALDLAIDGNGFFVVGEGDQRFYTRAGNFKIDDSGYIIDQQGNNLLGFPSGGSGALENLSINAISQSNVGTGNVDISGNLDAGNPLRAAADQATHAAVSVAGVAVASTTTYAELSAASDFSTVVDIFDSLGQAHTATFFFYKDDATSNQYYARGYVNSEEVDTSGAATGIPRMISSNGLAAGGLFTLNFNSDGSLNTATSTENLSIVVPWNNGSTTTDAVDVDFSSFTQFASGSSIRSISQDGQGIGAVTSLSIQSNGDIFALLTNGQTTTIGTVGMVNFSNPEGLARVGGNLLQRTPQSGEPIIGRAETGTFGGISSGSLELSTVDIASEFVKLITLQRGFQANSRIITTINQLLQEIIQLA